MDTKDCCILNAGGGSWAFAPLANQLSRALWVDVAEEARSYSYLLLADDAIAQGQHNFFIPFASLELAADKRCLARVFAARSVPTPETHLMDSLNEARRVPSVGCNVASSATETVRCLQTRRVITPDGLST